MANGNQVLLDGDKSEIVFSFSFDDKAGERVRHEARVGFQRTLRIPDDGKEYPLPAGLGQFPLFHSRSKALRLPKHMISRGGVVFPIYPFEATWMSFECRHDLPIALRIAAGKINAVSGEDWDEAVSNNQDYVVLPDQYWLDGFNTGDGQVRQFVAAKLGANLTVEEQLTEKAEWGGLQILAIPMKVDNYQRILEEMNEEMSFSDRVVMCASEPPQCLSMEMDMKVDMGMGQGGAIRQAIEEDIYGVDAWDFDRAQRAFISMIDARSWPDIGGEPISTPVTADIYDREGIPWFDLEGFSDIPKSESLRSLKTVQTGMVELGVEIDEYSPNVNVTHKIKSRLTDGPW